ncbi:hypothetical protein E4T50_01897 [Aureobasidium sp. EXF-12298]|nr:hypothetical protein E4T50_01897 [Aureobasidium sp. EXF-12298]
MFQPNETQSPGNGFSQRLAKPRTKHTSTGLGKAETSSTNTTPINTTTDYAEDFRGSYFNDSPLSLTGSASYRNSESPSRSATNLPTEGIRSRKASNTANTSKRHTIAVDNSDVDVAAAIALLQELKKRASPEDLILLHKALLPTRNVERTIAPSQPENKDHEEPPISPLIRRSSLLPAGVKTRLSRELLRNYSENNVTVRSASVSRQHVPTESPRLDVPLDFEALDLADGGAELQGGRPTTPSNFYPQIGTYKMGSLRITNGSASPEPARLLQRVEKAGIQRKPSVPESSSGEGFTTADEGEPSLEHVRPSRATVVSLRAPRRSSEQQDRKPSSDARARSKSRGPPVRRSIEAETSRSAAQPSRPQAAQRASEYAQEYTSEFDTLENPHMSNPALTTTVSRLSTVHDESPVEGGIDAREEALRKLTGDASTAIRRAQKPQTQTHLNVARPLMTKSDSGYSSEVSRRSIIRESNPDEVLNAALGAADQAERTRSKESLPALRPSLEQISEDNVSSPQSPYMQQQISAVQKAERHRSLPSFFFKKSSSSTSVNKITTPPVAPVTPVKQTRKLQKSRPQSQMVVPEQLQEQEPVLPEVEPEFVAGDAEDLSVNFSRPTRRLERGPSASPQTQEENDRDARGRGRSRRDDVASQTAAAEGSPDGATRKRSRSFFRFRSRSRSKSQHRREEEITVLSVADEPLPAHDFSDFGTVAQSLGQSPYDIATRRVKQMGPYDPSKPWFHPHEISRAAPKPDLSSEAQQSRGKSVDRSRQDRARSQSRPRESIDAVLSRPPTRGRATRSQSAHNIAVPRVPEAVSELPKQTETMSGTFSHPASKDGNVRVGTIDFGTGFAQGRLEPILTNSEKAKTRRRTQSVAPRVRPRSVVVPEEAVPIPQRKTQQPAQTPSSEVVKARELPQVTAEKRSQALPLELPQLPSRAPPKVPAHGKQPNHMNLSVSTKPTDIKESTIAPHTPASPVSPAARSSWESQALAWRERKQNLNEMLSSPVGERKSFALSTPASPAIQAYSPTMQAPRRAPTVIVSRYITPQGSEFAMHLGEEGSYRKLHSEDPYRHRSEDPYRKLHHDNPTDLRPAQEDVERTDSSSTYRTATSERSQDSFASRDSAKYRTQRPSENTTPEKTSAPPASRSNITQKRSSRVYEQPQAQAQAQAMPRPQRRSTAPPENQNVAYDRFSGGLGYGWERGIGFGGSAGTRQKNDTKAARKSVAISQNFGVDLSDVPVFMVRN